MEPRTATELVLDDAPSKTRELSGVARQRLSKCFTRCRKSPAADHSGERQDLGALIEKMLRERDELP